MSLGCFGDTIFGAFGTIGCKKVRFEKICKKRRTKSGKYFVVGAVGPLKEDIQTAQQHTQVTRTRHECLAARWRIGHKIQTKSRDFHFMMFLGVKPVRMVS